MGLISQCIVAISVLSYTFYIVECVSSQEAREVCEQNLQNPDQVYTNKTVAHEFSKCMEVQLECGQIQGQQFTACPNRCEKSCNYYITYLKDPSDDNPPPPVLCMTRCPNPRCICKEGKYRQGNDCVSPEKCVAEN